MKERRAARERLFTLIDQVQARTRGVPPPKIRKLVREAVETARRTGRRGRA